MNQRRRGIVVNRGLLIAVGAVASIALVATVGRVTDGPTDTEWKQEKVGMILREDGVDVRGVYCEFAGCWVTLATGRVTTVALENYEDGSWNIAEGSRP